MQLLIDLVGLQQDPVGILILVQGGTSSGTGTADLDCQTRACGATSTCTEVQLYIYVNVVVCILVLHDVLVVHVLVSRLTL